MYFVHSSLFTFDDVSSILYSNTSFHMMLHSKLKSRAMTSEDSNNKHCYMLYIHTYEAKSHKPQQINM